MRLTRVETEAFRNLVDLQIEPEPRFNVLCGDNAQGKTNFLEAVYLIACQRSFRATRTADMIRFGAPQARVDALADVGPLRRELQVCLRPDGKRATVDGKGARAGSAALEGLSAVLFCPEDLQLPRGSPEQRRRLVDRAILSVWRGYHQLQRDYAKTLQARNRLLREQPRDLSRLMDVYDRQLCELGAGVAVARRRYLTAIEPTFAEVLRSICRAAGAVRYRSSCEVANQAEAQVAVVAAALRRELAARRSEEIARRTSCAGPHTDDIDFVIDGRSARHYGSQGQVRSMVLAFRITQIIEANQTLGHHPILLLDDVSSELDPKRNSYLFDFIREISCQVFLTTTRPELVPLSKNIKYFKVVNGAICAENGPLP